MPYTFNFCNINFANHSFIVLAQPTPFSVRSNWMTPLELNLVLVLLAFDCGFVVFCLIQFFVTVKMFYFLHYFTY